MLILGFSLGLVCAMLPVFTFPALLPGFKQEWGLNSTEAGWISGIYFAGYALSVVLLTSLTDLIDARRVCQFSALIGVLGALGFALGASGFWSAMFFRCIGGISMAGTYMPGLKALTDRLDGPIITRATAFYTSSAPFGFAISFLIAGEVSASSGWQTAFGVASFGGIITFLIVTFLITPKTSPAKTSGRIFFDPRQVLRNRETLGYIICYFVHSYELFGFRAWMVAFLVFAAQQNGQNGINPTLLTALIVFLGLPASVCGNELSLRFGRKKSITAVMLVSSMIAFVVAFSALHSVVFTVLAFCVYGIFVMADSSSITAGALQSAPQELRGITLATFSSLGFIGSFMGPVGFGWILDQFSGGELLSDWVMAFASLGMVLLLGPFSLAVLGKDDRNGKNRKLLRMESKV